MILIFHFNVVVDSYPYFLDEYEDFIHQDGNNKYDFGDKISTSDISVPYPKRGWEGIDIKHQSKRRPDTDYNDISHQKRAWEAIDLRYGWGVDKTNNKIPATKRRTMDDIQSQNRMINLDSFDGNNKFILNENNQQGMDYSKACSCCSGKRRNLSCCLACQEYQALSSAFVPQKQTAKSSSKDKWLRIQEASCQCCSKVGVADCCHLCTFLSK